MDRVVDNGELERAGPERGAGGDDGAAEQPAAILALSSSMRKWIRPMWTRVRKAAASATVRRHVERAVEVERNHGHGFLWHAAFFAVGAALWRVLSHDVNLWLLVVSAVACAGLARLIETYSWVFTPAAVVFGGLCVSEIEAMRRAHVVLDSPIVTNVTGVVEARELDYRGDWRYTIDVTATGEPELGRPPDRVRILARSDHEAIEIGGTIGGLARLSPPSGPAMPGTFDFSFNAYFSGLGGYGFFYGPPDNLGVKRREVTLYESAARAVRDLRERIAFRIRDVLPGDAGAVAAAMTVSDRRAISEETKEAFRVTGLAHILSISGLHMSLAAGIMFTGLRSAFSLLPGFVQSFPVKKLAAAGAILTSTFYLFISGAVIPAQRAWIMVLIMLVAVLVDRPALTLRNVAIAAIVILIISPSAVSSPGFQMSFAATAALIASYGAWSRRAPPELSLEAPRRRGWLRGILVTALGLALTSVIAGLATGIFSAHHFHRMSSFGFVANVAAMPLISVIVMPMGVVALLAMPFGIDRLPLMAMGWGLDAVIWIGHAIADLGGDIATGQVPLAVTGLLTAALVIVVFSRTWLCLAAAVPTAAALFLLVASPFSRPDVLIAEDGRLVAIAGDGILVTNRTRPPSFIFEQWQAAMRSGAHLPPMVEEAALEATVIPAAPAVESGTGKRAVEQIVWPDYPTLRREVEAAVARYDAGASNGAFLCADQLWCLIRRDGVGLIVTVEEPAFIGVACDLAAVVVTPAPLAMTDCRSGAELFTARTLRQTGAVALHVEHADDGRSDSMANAGSTARGAAQATTTPGAIATDVDNAGYRVETALGGVMRPWTIHRYYDWRSRSFVEPYETYD